MDVKNGIACDCGSPKCAVMYQNEDLWISIDYVRLGHFR